MAAESKTQLTGASVETFLNALKDKDKRADCWTVVDIMQKATRAKPLMWGANIVGFGSRVQKYANGREAKWMLVAFAPRKPHITMYLMSRFEGRDALLGQLGKHSCAGSCVHIKRLSDIHLPTLKKLVTASVKHASIPTQEGT